MRGGWVGISWDFDEGLSSSTGGGGGRGGVVGVAAAIGGRRRRRSMNVRIIERQGGHSRGRDESRPMPTGQRSVLMPVGIVGIVVVGLGRIDVGSSDGSDGREEWNRSKSHDGCGRSLHFNGSSCTSKCMYVQFGSYSLQELVRLECRSSRREGIALGGWSARTLDKQTAVVIEAARCMKWHWESEESQKRYNQNEFPAQDVCDGPGKSSCFSQ